MQLQELKRVKKSFQWAIEKKLLRFIIEKESNGVSNWLTIEYREPNGATPSEQGYTWKLLCAQRLSDYKTREHLVNRITLMLADKVSSATQDLNIMNTDYTLTRN